MSVRSFLRRRRRLLLAVAGVATLSPVAATADDGDRQERIRTADLMLAISGAPERVQAGRPASFALEVANLSERSARRVRVAIAVTPAAPITSLGGPGWRCDTGAAPIVCSRRRIGSRSTASLTLTLDAPRGFSRIGVGASVVSRDPDPDETNNGATAQVEVNNPPVAVGDSVTTAAGVPVTFEPLGNDFDTDGDGLFLTDASQPTHGTVVCDDLACTYTPQNGFTGPDTFTYTSSDGSDGTAIGAVNVTVTAPPPPPPPPPGPPTPPGGGQPQPPTTTPTDPNANNAAPGASVSGPLTVSVGPIATFTTLVTNSCSVTARNVVVRIALPAGATVVGRPAASTIQGRTLTVKLGALRRATPRVVRVRLRFSRSGGALRTLVSSVSSANGRLAGDGVVIAVR